jgi:integrase
MLQEENQRERIATEAEYLLMRSHLPEPLRPILTLCWELGLRISEVLKLRWPHVDLLRDVLEIHDTKRRPRVIPLPAHVKALLLAVPRTEERLFPVSRHAFNHHYRQAIQTSGVRGLWVHDFRRTFITRKLAEGWDYKRIMLITGHRSLVVFDRYAKPTLEHLREVLQRDRDKSLLTAPEQGRSARIH